jgi:hypothetical protein
MPLWTATIGAGGGNSSPAVANGVVYVGSRDAHLYAFAVGCASGGGVCTPLWKGTTYTSIDYSSPAVANGVVYVGSNVNGSSLYAFAVGCASGGGTCSPHLAAETGGIESPPTVANGVVYVGSTDGKLYAFGLNPPDHLVLSPASATIAAGGSQAYTAQGFDAYNISLGDATSATTFTISGGGSCTGASCTSTVVGDRTVTGTDGSATGTATLHVTPSATVPGKPTGVTATAGNGSGVVSWTAPASNGGSAITGYTVTSSPDGKTCTTSATSCTVSGLTSGQPYTFTVTATNAAGTGPASDPSSSITVNLIGATYHALTPTRILDSRDGYWIGLAGAFSSHVARTFQVSGHGGVPANATAVTGNLTVTGQTAAGFLYVGPNAANDPTSSTLNFPQVTIGPTPSPSLSGPEAPCRSPTPLRHWVRPPRSSST